jgi:hypothetical protein
MMSDSSSTKMPIKTATIIKKVIDFIWISSMPRPGKTKYIKLEKIKVREIKINSTFPRRESRIFINNYLEDRVKMVFKIFRAFLGWIKADGSLKLNKIKMILKPLFEIE